MTALLVGVPEFRERYAVAVASRSDEVVQGWLDEAEAALLTDVGTAVETVLDTPAAYALAHGEVLRRAANLMGQANSPEGRASVEDGIITIPTFDPGSPQTVMRLKRALGLPRAVFA